MLLRYTVLYASLVLSSLVFIVESKACDENPCGEGNKCVERGRRFKCQCKPGLYGKRCNKGELHRMRIYCDMVIFLDQVIHWARKFK